MSIKQWLFKMFRVAYGVLEEFVPILITTIFLKFYLIGDNRLDKYGSFFLITIGIFAVFHIVFKEEKHDK